MSGNSNGNNVDPAALAAAVFAAAITILAPKGPFGIIGFIIGSTLLLIVCSYEYRRKREVAQNFAFGAVCGLISLLIVGYIIEVWAAGWRLNTEEDAEGKAVEESIIKNDKLAYLWFGLTIIFTVVGWRGSEKAHGCSIKQSLKKVEGFIKKLWRLGSSIRSRAKRNS